MYAWGPGSGKRFGQVYKGSFVNGEREGKGVETYPDGDFYNGSFKNGLKHGRGRYTFAAARTGRFFEGPWENGEFKGTSDRVL